MSEGSLYSRAGAWLILSLGIASGAYGAAGDAALVLRWTDPAERTPRPDRTTNVVVPPRALGDAPRLMLEAPGSSLPIALPTGAGETHLTLVPPGLARIELRTTEGELAGEWELPLLPEVTTVAVLDFTRDELRLEPAIDEPFGDWRVWSREELTVLPGSGRAALDGLDPSVSSARPAALDQVLLRDSARGRSTGHDLDQIAVLAATPLGTASAAWAHASSVWPLARTPRGTSVMGRFSAAGGDQLLGQLGFAARSDVGRAASLLQRLRVTDVEAWLQGSRFDQSRALSFSRDALPANDADGLSALVRVTARPGGLRPPGAPTTSPVSVAPGLLRLQFYAAGSDQRRYLHEFRDAHEHAPREIRGLTIAAADYDFSVAGLDASVGAGWRRELTEVGDGKAFDVFEDYLASPGSVDPDPFALYWQADDPTTPQDEGRLWDYYLRTAVQSLELRSEVRLGAVGRSARRALVGATFAYDGYRIYEHLAPSAAARGFGYGLAHYLGYSEDGDQRTDAAGHDAPHPIRLALYGALPLRAGGVDLEIGARVAHFNPGERPLRDPMRPVGDDGAVGDAQLAAEETHTAVLPAVGLHLRPSEASHLWIDAAQRWTIPPYQALFFSRSLLSNLAAAAEANQLVVGRRYVFGSPDLGPELETAAHAGLLHDLGPRLAVRWSLRGARVEDPWVVRAVPLGPDTLHLFDQRGERRSVLGQAEIRWQVSPASHARLLYALGRSETNVIEPTDLLHADPSRAIPSAGVTQSGGSSPLWLDDGREREFFPSDEDRTHRFALAYFIHFDPAEGGLGSLLPDWDAAVTARLASGRPYTPIYARAEGLVETIERTAQPITPDDPNSERLPWTGQVDLGLSRRFAAFGGMLTLRLEARNLTDQRNVLEVYGATGEEADDGWLRTPDGVAAIASQGSEFARDYRERLEDPLHLDDGLTGRVALTLEY